MICPDLVVGLRGVVGLTKVVESCGGMPGVQALVFPVREVLGSTLVIAPVEVCKYRTPAVFVTA
jgi:hypothetical protein